MVDTLITENGLNAQKLAAVELKSEPVHVRTQNHSTEVIVAWSSVNPKNEEIAKHRHAHDTPSSDHGRNVQCPVLEVRRHEQEHVMHMDGLLYLRIAHTLVVH